MSNASARNAPAPGPGGRKLRFEVRSISEFAQRFGVFIALILLCLVLSIVNDHFLTGRNLMNVLRVRIHNQ